jgi:hypothetical protein
MAKEVVKVTKKQETENNNDLKTVNETMVKENEKKHVVIKDNEIFIEGKGIVELKATKLKYFKDKSYNGFIHIKNFGIHELFKYEDAEDIIKKFIGAALDIDTSEINIDDISTKTLYELIDKINKINEINESDFLAKLQEAVVVDLA